jgi:hypothetical protein
MVYLPTSTRPWAGGGRRSRTQNVEKILETYEKEKNENKNKRHRVFNNTENNGNSPLKF